MSGFLKYHYIFISVILGLAVAAAIYAFTGPSQSPPTANPSLWLMSGTNLYYNAGKVGIGTTTPGYLLDVEGGDISAASSTRGATSVCIGATCWSQWQDVPAGAVMFFNLASCPSGWSEFTAGRGRYIVGLNSGGTLASTVGTALSNLENRPVGQHSHTINDPGHYHTGMTVITGSGPWGSGGSTHQLYNTGGNSYTGITVNSTGTVAGTNAPYIQYLVCQKS